MKKKLVVLTGAGISAESGLSTFRYAGGLWEGNKIEDVATPEAWRRNKGLVLDFYNERRKTAMEAKPNDGHRALVALEEKFDVTIITQNVDDLHERAGSSKIIHLHGDLFTSRSSLDEKLVYPIEGWELKLGDRCEKGSQLRPNIVWFGEAVPKMEEAEQVVCQADIFIVVGTSLQVYPAAGLIQNVEEGVKKFIVDPAEVYVGYIPNLEIIKMKAGEGMEKVKALLFEIED